MWVMASLSSSSVLPLSLARPRWYTSCSVAPRVASTETVTRLRSLADKSARGHTSPKRTSSVKCTKAGAKSPNAFCAPEASLSLVMSGVSFHCGDDGDDSAPQVSMGSDGPTLTAVVERKPVGAVGRRRGHSFRRGGGGHVI